MLHDDITEYMHDVFSPVQIWKKSGGDKKLVDAKFERFPEFYLYQYFVNHDFPVFYCNGTELTHELLQTGYHFFNEGYLKLPFENCMFCVKNMHFILPGDKVVRDDVAYIIHQEDNKLVFMFIDENVGLSPIITALSPTGISTLPLESHTSDDNMEMAIHCAKLVLAYLMLLGSKYTVKETCNIPDKLNKRREKRGKPRLKEYTKIQTKIIQHTPKGDTHASPHPHWRRGHIRLLPSGKRVPVAPCLVNVDKDSMGDVPYNIYTTVPLENNSTLNENA